MTISSLKRIILTGALAVATHTAAFAIPIINPGLNNGSFELPATGSFTNLDGTTTNLWTYDSPTSIAGVSTNNVGSYQSAGGQTGAQYAFLQGVNGITTVSQTFNLAAIADVFLSYDVAGRLAGGGFGGLSSSFQAFIDATPIGVGTGTASSSVFANRSGSILNLAAGAHTLSFVATFGAGDNTALLDNVNLSTIEAPELDPKSSLTSLALIFGGLLVLYSRKTGAATIA